MRRPYGVIFDLGDTVLRLESVDPLAANRRVLEFAENTPQVTVEDIKRAADEIYDEVNRIRDELWIEFGWQKLNRLLFQTLGVSFKISYAELEKKWWNASTGYKPSDGIFEVLDMLDKYQIKTGIISNTSFTETVLKQELAKHNLAYRFSFVISSTDYGFRKPHKRIFQLAVRMINLKPEDIWFVGDKLEYDVKGAINSGLFPVWYNCRKEPGNTNYQYLEINDWFEFIDRIEAICKR